jgi:hypothetical protein
MCGLGGFGTPTGPSYFAQQVVAFFHLFSINLAGPWLNPLGVLGRAGALALLLAAIAFLPNSQQLVAGLRPALQKVTPSQFGRWLGQMFIWRLILGSDGSIRLSALTGFMFAGMLLAAVIWQTLRATSLQPFIYFQF